MIRTIIALFLLFISFNSLAQEITTTETFSNEWEEDITILIYRVSAIGFTAALSLLFWLLYILNKREKHLLYIAITVTCFFLFPLAVTLEELDIYNEWIQFSYLRVVFLFGIIVTIPLTIAKIYRDEIPRWQWIYSWVLIIYGLSHILIEPLSNIILINLIIFIGAIISFITCLNYFRSAWKTLKGSKWAIVIGLIGSPGIFILSILIFYIPMGLGIIESEASDYYEPIILLSFFCTFPFCLLVYVSMWLKETQQEVGANASKVIQVTQEKKDLLANQNVLLEKQVIQRTQELKSSLEDLKSTQSQLIQSEKMASLGELTAGIAHEIQNPLNFVNNFSEVSNELIKEIQDIRHKTQDQGNKTEEDEILNDIANNLEKINHHGKRASDIVKGMLQHSRSSSGIKEPTDINALADEYLRLAYHGLRAKDKAFNAKFETDFDSLLPKLNVVPQDIGRVVLNLINNAFYAVNERLRQARLPDGQAQPDNAYEPTVTVSTKHISPSGGGKKGEVIISVKDNGLGIPESIKEKIFQPFFTTKPTGQGTGLGLSLSYDIVKAHGGEIKIESKEGMGSEFVIQLPIV